MNSVLISHFLTTGVVNVQTFANETLIFLIGVAFGFAVNLHLHKNTKEMNRLKNVMNQSIKNILKRMSLRILDKNLENYDGTCFEKLNDYLIDAKILAQNNYQNQLKKDETDIKYLENLT